jgi:lipopolysaccharide heptosyltransferase III
MKALRTPDMEQEQAIVIFRLGSMGDIIVSLPCFHAIARRFPSAKRVVLTNAPLSGLAAPIDLILGGSGLIDETVFYSPDKRALPDARRISGQLRALGARTLIYLTERNNLFQVYRDLAFFRLSGFSRIVGAPMTRNRVHARRDRTTGELEFEAERLSRCMSAFGPIDLNNRESWDLRLTDDEIAAADRCLQPLEERPFVAINPGGKEETKDWGDRNWSTLLSALSARYRELALVIVGAGPERQRFDQLGASWSGRMINAAGTLLPRESAALLRRAVAFIGHDSGPMHLAACAGIRCLALFGASNSRAHTWYPYGQGHRVMHERRGMALIAPESVLQEIERMLGDKVSSRPVSNAARPA